MAVTTEVSIETYLRTAYEPDAEYVDGEIEERAIGEDNHSAWQIAIAYWFRMHAEQWNIRVRSELRVQTSETRFRVPDIAILDASLPREPIATHPPLGVFEILSPEDTHKRLMRKLGDYEQMGIPAIWVIDPDTGASERYEAGHLVRREHFSLPGFEFPMQAIADLVA